MGLVWVVYGSFIVNFYGPIFALKLDLYDKGGTVNDKGAQWTIQDHKLTRNDHDAWP